MTIGPWTVYNDFKASAYKKLMDLNGGDTLKVLLLTSATNAFNSALVSAVKATLTNELATSGGYTAGGATASSPTISGGGAVATATLDTANVAWTASGGGFTARGAVLYDDTAAADNLIAYCVFQDDSGTPANAVLVAGETLTLTIINVFGNS